MVEVGKVQFFISPLLVYHIVGPVEARETIERVHQIHAQHCPVYRSLHNAIEITTEYQLAES